MPIPGLRRGGQRVHTEASLSRVGSAANPARIAGARLAFDLAAGGVFVLHARLYLPKEPWLAATFEAPSPLRVRRASGVTTKPRSPSGIIRTGSSSASTAAGVAGTRRTRRPADRRAPAPPWHVIGSGRSSAKPSAAHAASPSRAATIA